MPLLPTGKLPADLLQAVLDKHARHDPRVFVGPRVGEDAAVIDLGDRYLVATADPITFATDELGWYALHVNANDIAAIQLVLHDTGAVAAVEASIEDLRARAVASLASSRLTPEAIAELTALADFVAHREG